MSGKLWMQAAQQRRESVAKEKKEAEEKRLKEIEEKAASLGTIEDRKKGILEKFGFRAVPVHEEDQAEPAPQAEPKISKTNEPKKPIMQTREVSVPTTTQREKKKKAIALFKNGEKPKQISEKLAIPYSTLCAWRQEAGLGTGKRLGKRKHKAQKAKTKSRSIKVVDPDESIDALIMHFEEVRHQHLDAARKLEVKIKALRDAR